MQSRKRDTDVQNRLLDTVGEGLCGGCFERTALKHVYYLGLNRSPAQVRCMRPVLRAGAPGKTQRDGRGREVGGGIGMGNTCGSMADSCQCMAKITTIF